MATHLTAGPCAGVRGRVAAAESRSCWRASGRVVMDSARVSAARSLAVNSVVSRHAGSTAMRWVVSPASRASRTCTCRQ